jgi:dihydrofolate reductase
MQEIIIIAAMAENRTIGKDNKMPWSLKEGLGNFKELTMGWPCIMGRKTWESLPKKPLPGRLNIVISRALSPRSELCLQGASSVPREMLCPQGNALSPGKCSVSREMLCPQGEEILVFSSLTAAIEHCAGYE